MRIYLVRHGRAIKTGYATDEERTLTDSGQRDVARIAKRMAKAGVEVRQIRHSGLVRAQQTAEIFAKYLEPPAGVTVMAALHYSKPVEVVADQLNLEAVMYVGHNPFMERLAGLLLTGDANAMPVWFTTSCTVCLENNGEGWTVRWVLTPEITSKGGKTPDQNA